MRLVIGEVGARKLLRDSGSGEGAPSRYTEE